MFGSKKISGYVSIFDDWDILPEALASIDPLVDEIVVVDGAYDWIVPFLEGRDGRRSRDEVYDALAPYSSKVKVINQTWTDEVQKRRAGFDACSGRFVLRHDADEVFFIDEDAVERFLKSNKAVSQIDMPIFVTPDRVRVTANNSPQCQGALFDSKHIDSTDHLNYLWLVLPKELELGRPKQHLIAHEPFAFVPHLTAWRTPVTSTSRALFYSMLYVRNGGHFPLTELEMQQSGSFRESLLGHSIVAGPLDMGDCRPVAPPMTSAQIALLRPLYDRYLQSLATLNRNLEEGRMMLNGGRYSIDLTSEAACASAGSQFRYGGNVLSCEAFLTTIADGTPSVSVQPLPVEITGDTIRVETPPFVETLQRTLTLTTRCEGAAMIGIQSLR